MIIEREPDAQHLSAWNLQVGRAICANIEAGLDREWLVTNGLGGYASGSIVGATTRSYHGLLVAALHPPVERTVMVTKIDEEVRFPDGQTLALGVNEYQGGALDPRGNDLLEFFALEGDVARFLYRLSETLTLEKRIWMEYGQNTTYIQYMLHGVLSPSFDLQRNDEPDRTISLTLSPFCVSRNYHSTTQGAVDWHFKIESQSNHYQVQAHTDASGYQFITGPEMKFSPTGFWYWRVFHRRDAERGLPDAEDVYQPGIFEISLLPGQRTTLVLSAETTKLARELGGHDHEEAVQQALARHHRRIRQLLSVANNSVDDLQGSDPVRARLVVAADQFIVARPDYESATSTPQIKLSPNRKTIIAGYPWFTDWGRDSMIALPGLLLATGRYSEARGLLKAFASFTHNGLIPNRFPDDGEAPEYNTADATLWMFYALDRYLASTADWTLLKELFPTLQSIIDWHVRGTDFNIGVDATDGLLHEGELGLQLTWMDAKVGDWVVTPRHGKPVEINALWYNALKLMEAWAVHLSVDAEQYSQLRSQVGEHFAECFWYEEGGYLYDVVDVDGIAGKHDASLRPNQLLAASFAHDLLSEEQMISMFQHVTTHLLTPLGLRSLSPQDPDYHRRFNGPLKERDAAYHQGAVWPWLIGPYVDAYLRIHNDKSVLQTLLQPFIQNLWEACLGTISEVVEPEPPYTPGGCFAQAWSVAELLRCWQLVSE